MKKIAFFINFSDVYGGVEKVTASLANEISKRAEVYIISFFKKKNKKVLEWYPENVKFLELEIETDHVHKSYFSAKKAICNIINEYKFDIVILQFISSGFYGKDIRKNTNAKVISCDHGYIFIPHRTCRLDLKLIRTVLGCDDFVVLTERCKKRYISKYHVPADKIHVIPNWIDETIENNSGYDKNSQRLISVGRLHGQKGFDMLVEAFYLVHQKRPGWILDIYGDGVERESIEKLIKEKQLEDSIILKGKRLDMTNLYSGYSFYVMSSRYEGLPMVLLEAKQNYLPIVSFDLDAGPSDVITDGVNGLLVEPGNVQGLAEAMCRLIDNPELRQAMSDKTQIDIDKFRKTVVLERWLKLLDIED